LDSSSTFFIFFKISCLPRPGPLTRHIIKATSVVIIGNITLLVNRFLHFKLLHILLLSISYFHIYIYV